MQSKPSPMSTAPAVSLAPSDREALIRLHTRLVTMTRRRSFPWLTEADGEDCESYGLIGLIKAADAYDPARGASFQTFAILKIRSEMSTWFARFQAVQDRGEVSLDEPLTGISAEGSLSRLDLLADPAADAEALVKAAIKAADKQRFWQRALGVLTPKQAEALRLHYLDGLTWETIAAQKGVTAQAVSYLHMTAIRRLRQRFPRTLIS